MRKKERNVRVNLTLPADFSDLLTVKAEKDYMPTATWIKQFLMRNLNSTTNNKEEKSINSNGKNM